MQAIEALLQRFSGRVLKEPAPDEGALRLMFDAAVRAPDHGRLRPWRFLVIQGEGRTKFGELLADCARRTKPTATAESLERERQKAFRAPLIIVVAAIIQPSAKVPVIEQILSAGAAAQNILLAAFTLGFNAVWKTGDAAYDETVKAALGLEKKDAIVGIMYVGTEEAPPPGLARPSAQEYVRAWEG
ncbi:MAG TPA: nitroreductase [Steroidobacteraceae bacterium]|jgi:nitroreductase